MIIFVTPSERQKYKNYLDQYFTIRKKHFCDIKKWVKPNSFNQEKDNLDNEYNITILYIDPESDQTVGGVRIVPTIGKTLIHDVWADMLPEPNDFRSPNIWEATRFCVDDNDQKGRNRNFVNRISLAIMLSLIDFASSNGITSVIAVCENNIFKMIKIFNSNLDILSTKIDDNGTEIICALFATNDEVRASLDWARPFIGGTVPVIMEDQDILVPNIN